MAAILNNLPGGRCSLLDEIHRLNRQVEEVLYPAMEDFAIDIMIGKRASARSIRLDLPKFTFSRCHNQGRTSVCTSSWPFWCDASSGILQPEGADHDHYAFCRVLGVEIDEKGAAEIAKRSRGTPRLANRLLKRVRDFCPGEVWWTDYLWCGVFCAESSGSGSVWSG